MKTRQTHKEHIEPAAKNYVDEQLAILEKHGVAPKLSAREYEVLVRKVARATAK